MMKICYKERKTNFLTPSGLRCLAGFPTVNISAVMLIMFIFFLVCIGPFHYLRSLKILRSQVRSGLKGKRYLMNLMVGSEGTGVWCGVCVGGKLESSFGGLNNFESRLVT